MNPTVLLVSPLRALVAQVRAAWSRGPAPCWTDYLHQTADKA